MSELPKGWVKTRLESIANIEMGQSPSGSATNTDQVGFPLIGGASDFQNGEIVPSRYTSKPTKLSKAGDLILCIRATIGKLAISNGELCLGRGVAGLRPVAIHPSLLAYFLRHEVDALNEAGTGTTFRQIDKATLSSWSVPLPPLAEQRRIVAKLDRLFARTRRASEELARIPRLIAHYKQAILATAFRGDLTKDWRVDDFMIEGEPWPIPTSWEWKKIQDIAEIASNLVQPSKVQDLPHIAPNHIESGIPRLMPYTTVQEDAVISPKHRFFPGQIIYSKIRPYLRKAVLVDFDGVCSADMYPIWPKCNELYLLYWLISPDFNDLAMEHQGRTVLPKINQKALYSLPIPLPPNDEQQRIAKLITEAFEHMNRLTSELTLALVLTDRLDQANLAKAFRGELIPQDPNDEPASALLERIRAGRGGTVTHYRQAARQNSVTQGEKQQCLV
jgi:type I restriction enzyme, S subunit